MKHFNTTNLEGNELKEAEQKATKQEKRIYNILFQHPTGLPNAVICTIYKSEYKTMLKQCSCSRSLTNMTKSGKLEKMGKDKKILVEGFKCHQWRVIYNESK